jgi:hypothetical protein
LEFLPRRLAVDREIASTSFAAYMRKTQKVKCLWGAITAFSATLSRVSPEFD